MNFLWYIVWAVIFSLLFWRVFSMVLALPAMGFGFLAVATMKESQTVAKRFVRVPLLAIARLLGVELIALSYGACIAFLTISYATRASYQWIYYVFGAFMAGTIAAPTGETSILARIESFGIYVLGLLGRGIVWGHSA